MSTDSSTNNRTKTKTKTEAGTSEPAQAAKMPRILALIVGAALVLFAIAGFFVTGFGDFAGPNPKVTLLGFQLNPLHNLVHLVVGVLGLVLALRAGAARAFGWILFVSFGAICVYGLFNDAGEVDLLALNSLDNWLHAVGALLGLLIALWPAPKAAPTQTSKTQHVDRTEAPTPVGRDTSGPTTDDAMTRSEERLHVGTEKRESGKAKLRKRVVTENVTKSVPVSREEVRIEREPITDANRAAATSGADITDEEHEVVLHEERPVVSKKTVPVERVRMDKTTVTGEQTVTDEVRKEQIEAEIPPQRHQR